MEDKGNWSDESVLHFHQDNPKVDVLAPSVGTLDQCRGLSEEAMRVSDGRILQFPWLLGESWGREYVNCGVDQQGVTCLLFSLNVELIGPLGSSFGLH